jgi:radical SAM protein with 4Fe4S-binding SPASM domain
MEEYHDRFRHVAGCFANTVEFIKALISRGFSVSVGFTLNNQGMNEIRKLCNMCKEIGVSTFRIGVISQRGRAKKNIKEDYTRVHKAIDLQSSLTAEFETDSFRIRIAGEFEELNDTSNCGYGHKMLKISAEGYVYPCLLSETIIGDLKVSKVKDILKKFSQIFSELRAPSNEYCNNCKYKLLCKNCINEALHYCKKASNCLWVEAQKDKIKQIESIRCNTDKT